MEITGLNEGQVITVSGNTVQERLARLEANEVTRDKVLEEIKADVKTLIGRFDQLSGGKKALVAITSVLGAIIAALVTWISRHGWHS